MTAYQPPATRQKDPIYGDGCELGLSINAGQILALARVGVAASDTAMNVHLGGTDYQGLFEVIGGIADRLTDDLIDEEIIGPKPATTDLLAAWHAAWKVADQSKEEPICADGLRRMTEIERAIIEAPTKSAMDLATKVFVLTKGFELDIDGDNAPKLMAEIRALVAKHAPSK